MGLASRCLDLDLYIAGTIFATALGERNANIKILLKKNSLCGFTVPLFQVFKNWLKCISALTAYVWGAAPCSYSTLPTADENAMTESTVTTVSSSLFQSATVLMKNEFLYCSLLLSGIFKPQEFRISCLRWCCRNCSP